MNENIDLTKILDGCPEGTEFYSPLFGELKFSYIYGTSRITLECVRMNQLVSFNPAGKYETETYDHYRDSYFFSDECLLFPSKDQRDWSKFVRFWDKPKIDKFDINTLQPFDKVLVRDYYNEYWRVDIFGFRLNSCVCCCTTNWRYCIPYNEETKHLVGTKEDCPKYYKWWEE